MTTATLPTHCGPYVKVDRGCRDVATSCVTCHLPQCKEDVPGGLLTIFAERRRMLVVGLRQQGWPVQVIVNRLQITRRTVYRLLEEA